MNFLNVGMWIVILFSMMIMNYYNDEIRIVFLKVSIGIYIIGISCLSEFKVYLKREKNFWLEIYLIV